MAHSNIINSTRLETLNKDNYDTWRIQVEALLTTNDLWDYVSGERTKPVPAAEDAGAEVKQARAAAIAEWTRQDRKARSFLILSISSSELVQVRDCPTSKGIWDVLDDAFASKGPARKATLLKQLFQKKVCDGDDIREHLNLFFDAVSKLRSMNVEINGDLLTFMLLNTLPDSFEYFRVAIETRDTLPTPDSLRVKILEEDEARRQKQRTSDNGASSNVSSPDRNSRRPATRQTTRNLHNPTKASNGANIAKTRDTLSKNAAKRKRPTATKARRPPTTTSTLPTHIPRTAPNPRAFPTDGVWTAERHHTCATTSLSSSALERCNPDFISPAALPQRSTPRATSRSQLR